MQLNCRSCGAEIDAANVNLDRMLAKCGACNAVFSFADDFEYAGSAEQAYRKLNLETPKGVRVDNVGSEVKISRRWFSPAIIALVFFALFWNGFLIFWFGMAFSTRTWFMGLFAIPHAAVGLGLLYYVVAGFVNTTEVRVNGRELTIRHGPLPWPGNKELLSTDIGQLYCKEKISHGRRSTRVTYEVHALTRANKREKLVTGLPDTDQALFLEQEIERYLGIQDRPVRGEVTA